MLTAESFLDILEQKDLLDAKIVEKLRVQVAASKAPVAPETIAQRLVERKYLTFAVAERILKQAREPNVQPTPTPATPTVVSDPVVQTTKPEVAAEPEAEAEGASTSGGRLQSLVSTPGRAALTAAAAVFVLFAGGGLVVLLIGIVYYFGFRQDEEAPTPSIPIEVSDKQPVPEEPIPEEPEPELGVTLNPREAEALRMLSELRELEQPSQADVDAALSSDDPFALLDLHIGTMEAMGDAINPEEAPQDPPQRRPPPQRTPPRTPPRERP